jgi:hypothetical protein
VTCAMINHLPGQDGRKHDDLSQVYLKWHRIVKKLRRGTNHTKTNEATAGAEAIARRAKKELESLDAARAMPTLATSLKIRGIAKAEEMTFQTPTEIPWQMYTILVVCT